MPLQRVVSGGQTGVDRGALDAALDCGFPCGGWCPAGRKAEDGVIPAHYPVAELAEGDYRHRTIQNVLDSDGTLVIYFEYLRGGTEQTVLHCIRRQRPYKLVDAAEVSAQQGVRLAAAFVATIRAGILNIAGPRHSQEPRAHAYAYALVSTLLRSPLHSVAAEA
jgi:hypothetical protein